MTSGVNYAFLLGKETSYGTTGTPDKDIGIVTNVESNLNRELVTVRGISETTPNQLLAGLIDSTQRLDVEYQHSRILAFILGEPTTASSGSDYRHTFPISAQPPSFTSDSGSNLSTGDIGLRTTGVRVESVELSVELNSILRMSVTTRGQKLSKLDTVPAHVVSSLPCFPTQTQCSVSLNDVEATKIQNFTVTITRTNESVAGINDDTHQDLSSTGLDVTFSGTLFFNTSTYRDHAIDDDITDIDFVANNGVSYGSGKRALELSLANIFVNSYREVAQVGQITVIDIEGTATIDECLGFDNISGANFL